MPESSYTSGLTTPDVMLMTEGEAKAALIRYGHSGEISRASGSCGSTTDYKDDPMTIVELGRVCYQHPYPGKPMSARSPISLRIQHENPYRGTSGSNNIRWVLVPKLVGLPLDQARARLREVGYDEREPKIYWRGEECAPGTICKSLPEHRTRAGVRSELVLVVGGVAPETSSVPTSTRPTSTP